MINLGLPVASAHDEHLHKATLKWSSAQGHTYLLIILPTYFQFPTFSFSDFFSLNLMMYIGS